MIDSPRTLIHNLTLRQMQVLATVARTGSYTRAAEQLHLTQPTVYMQVKKLADVVQFPLFERVGKQLHLTTAGREIVSAAEDVLTRLSTLEDHLISIRGDVRGELRVAVVTTAKYFMPHLLGAFLQRYPGVTPYLTVTNRARVLEHLIDNHNDFIIMGQVPQDLDVHAYPFFQNELVVAAPPSHPLARASNIPLQRLALEQLLVREPGSGTRLALERMFAQRGVTVDPYMELGSSEAIKQAVIAGLGVSALSRFNLELELAGGLVCMLDVVGFPLKRDWYTVYLKSKQLSLVAQTFLDFVQDQGATLLRPAVATR